MKPTWPEKKERVQYYEDHGSWGNAGDSYDHGYDCGHADGFNEALSLCDAYKDAHKPHACQCQRHPDAAFTARQIDEGLLECPTCGGLIAVGIPMKGSNE